MLFAKNSGLFSRGNSLFQCCLGVQTYRNFSAIPLPKHPAARPQVDYTDLHGIALNLYASGIDEVSPTAMIKKAFNYHKDVGVLELYSTDFVTQRNQTSLTWYERQTRTHHLAIRSNYKVHKNIHVIAFGKAVTGMARAIEDVFGDDIVDGIMAVPAGCVQSFKDSGKLHLLPKANTRLRILEGGDANFPDEASQKAAYAIADCVKSLTADDLLITLVSGGGSTLVALPKPPVTLEDKVKVTKLLKNAGVTRLEMNTIRKNLSLLKGGGLAQMAAPAKVISLILSNLPHQKSAEVASGPTTPDYSTPHQALDIFRKYRVESQVPETIMELLNYEAKETASMKWFTDSVSFQDIYSGPKPRYDASNATNILAGSDEIAVSAILRQCSLFGIPACALMHGSSQTKDTKSHGFMFAAVSQYVAMILTRSARSIPNSELVQCELDCIKVGLTKRDMKTIAQAAEDACNTRKPVCLVFTSEMTVGIKGTGIGGPCQEVALATAIELKHRYDSNECLKKCDVQLFSIDSDGNDGSTTAAGAIANCHQAEKLVNGQSAQYYLDNNDSYTFYSKLEGGKYQVHTGKTGTDIQNFQLLLIRNKYT